MALHHAVTLGPATRVMIAWATLSLSVAALAAPRSESGRTLIIPAEHAALGTVYYILPGEDGQIVFTSDASLERITGVSGAVIGYAIAPTDDAPRAALLKGEFRLPVRSINTGLRLRDEHLRSGRWLNTEDHPDIVFTLDGAQRVTRADAPTGPDRVPGVEVWTADLVGAMTIRGVSRPLRVPARISVMPASPVTLRRAPGDLLAIRATFTINLREFGLNDPAMSAGMVAEDVSIDTFLLLSTVSPDTPR